MLKTGFYTARKERLWRGISYPVGSEVLKSTLADFPQLNEVVLNFYCGIRRSDHLLFLITVEYNPNGIGFDLENKWSISVCAVPTALKVPIRKLLDNDGFLRIKEWLIQSHPPSWFEAWKRLNIYFDTRRSSFLYEEDGKL